MVQGIQNSTETTDQLLGFSYRFVPGGDIGETRTVLLLHGVGSDEEDLLTLGRDLLPGATLLSPRGRVWDGMQSRFFRRLEGGDFDLEDLRTRTQELSDFLRAAARIYGFDSRQIIAIGYADGASIAASLLLLKPEALAKTVLFHPTAAFVSRGRCDTEREGIERERYIRTPSHRLSKNVAIFWPGEETALCREEYETARQWLLTNGNISRTRSGNYSPEIIEGKF